MLPLVQCALYSILYPLIPQKNRSLWSNNSIFRPFWIILWPFWSVFNLFFIGPESDHWLCFSVTQWLTHSLLFSKLDGFEWYQLLDNGATATYFINVTLACEDANSNLVDVLTVADDDRVGNNLLQIWKLRFGQKAKLLFRLWAQGLVKILKLKFRQDFKLEFFLLMFCRG